MVWVLALLGQTELLLINNRFEAVENYFWRDRLICHCGCIILYHIYIYIHIFAVSSQDLDFQRHLLWYLFFCSMVLGERQLFVPPYPFIFHWQFYSYFRDHEFDAPIRARRNPKRKSAVVSKPNEPARGCMPVRQQHRRDESKILITCPKGFTIGQFINYSD